MKRLALLLVGCGRLGFDVVGPPEPVARWKLDEGAGVIAADARGRSPGELVAGASVAPTWTEGIEGSAVAFTGDGDRINISPHDALDNLPALTVVAWVHPHDVGVRDNRGCITDKGLDDGGWVWFVGFTRVGDLAFTANYPSSQVLRDSPANTIPAGEWTRVAVSWDGSPQAAGVHLYVNGHEVSYVDETDATESRPDDTMIDLGIDCVADTGLPGVIDDVQIYDRVLSALEIADL